MAKAIETGLPKMKVEESAAKRQAKIDSKSEIIVGVNKYRLAEEDPIDILDIDNAVVREAQIKRLAEMKASRNEEEVAKTFSTLNKGSTRWFRKLISSSGRRSTRSRIS